MKRFIKALLLAGYCVPFVFLAVYGDAVWGTMLLYAAMPAGFALLCRGCLKTNNALICVVGSILSCVASVTAAKLTGLEPMGHYFKPFTSHSLIAVLSFASIVIHIIIITVVRAKK